MKAIWIFLLLMLSAFCLLGAFFLLPDLQPNAFQFGVVERTDEVLKLDTLTLPKFSDATFERLILERRVEPGDTLGYIFKDRYKALRDSLSAFAKTSKTQANFAPLPLNIRNGLREITRQVKAPLQAQSKIKRKTRYALSGIEREYLLSEIMGAEDASTELIGKLSHYEDSGRGNSVEALNFRLELSKKQAFISSAKSRLEKKIEYTTSYKATSTKVPNLTAAQRARILALSNELPIDTQLVFAPIAGRYYRLDDGAGYIIAPASRQKQYLDSTKNLKGEGSGYLLKAQGSPVLWGKAQRKDRKDESISSSGKELLISVD